MITVTLPVFAMWSGLFIIALIAALAMAVLTELFGQRINKHYMLSMDTNLRRWWYTLKFFAVVPYFGVALYCVIKMMLTIP